LPVLTALFSLPASASARGRRNGCASFRPGTPVSWKIRLND
jgi:hypothetical protein